MEIDVFKKFLHKYLIGTPEPGGVGIYIRIY